MVPSRLSRRTVWKDVVVAFAGDCAIVLILRMGMGKLPFDRWGRTLSRAIDIYFDGGRWCSYIIYIY